MFVHQQFQYVANGGLGWGGRFVSNTSLNKFFDPSTPSMRKVDDGEGKKKNKRKKRKKKKKIMTFIVATNVVASRPPERRTLMPK